MCYLISFQNSSFRADSQVIWARILGAVELIQYADFYTEKLNSIPGKYTLLKYTLLTEEVQQYVFKFLTSLLQKDDFNYIYKKPYHSACGQ